MKIILLVLCILAQGMAGTAWALADDLEMDMKLPITHTIMGGVIKSVSWADPAKGTKSEIIVKYGTGKITNIYVTSTTTLLDADEKAIMPDKIIPRRHVNVIYLTTPEGINEAKSIKIIK